MPSSNKTISKKEKVVIKTSIKKTPSTSHKKSAATKKTSTSLKRAEHNLVDASVSTPAIRRMAKRAAIVRISENSYAELQKISIRLLKSVLHNSMLYSYNKNRSILNTDAVNFGLEKSGVPLYV